ncbi:MAG: 1-deoxy-D-xylulose-5-phosphate reductoisomerase, partial [Candidatus Eiseniibacteriota bacterium]
MKPLSILGSTGSIGVSTLDVVGAHGDRFAVTALAAGGNLDLLERQIARHRPELVAVRDAELAAELTRRVGSRCRVVHGRDGLIEVAVH